MLKGGTTTPRRRMRPGHARRAAPLALLLALSALLVSVATVSAQWGWLGWISIVPLFAAIHLLGPNAALVAGGWWGLCLALGHAWLVGDGGSSRIPAIALATAVFSLYAGLGAALTRRIGYSPVVLAVGWIGVELALRPLGWRNGLLAPTQGSGALFAVVGGVFGYVLVAFLVALFNAWLLSAAIAVPWRPRTLRKGHGAGDPPLSSCPEDPVPLWNALLRAARPRAPPGIP